MDDQLSGIAVAHAGAAQLVDQYATETAAMPGIKPTAGVDALPAAKCFVRPVGWQPLGSGSTWRDAWHYTCIARADRYAFVAYSGQEKEIRQQIAAQYRILAGK